MARQATFWKGTKHEAVDLVKAIARHCTCKFGLLGAQLTTCPAHRMLREDQRALDGLLFGRCLADRWQREEFAPIQAEASAQHQGFPHV